MATETKQINVHINVTGDTKYLNAIARITAANAKRAETERRVAQATGQSAAANDKAAGSLQSLAAAQREAEKAARRNQIGMVQLGQQFQDFGIQVSGGTNPLVAFSQQASQAAFVASNMEGKIGAIGRFLSGPWIAITAAAALALTPLIKSFLDTGEESENAKKSITSLEQSFDFAKLSAEQLEQVNQLLADSNKDIAQTAIQAANATAIQAAENRDAAQAQLDAASATLKRRETQLAAIKTPGAYVGGGVAGAAVTAGQIAENRQNEAIAKQEAEVARLQKAIDGFTISQRKAEASSYSMSAALDASGKAAEAHNAKINNLRNDYAAGTLSREAFTQAVDEEIAAYGKLKDAMKAGERKSGGRKSGGRTREERDQLLELVNAYNEGGKAVYNYSKQIAELELVLKRKDLTEKGQIEVRTEITRLERERAALLDPLAAVELELTKAVEARAKAEAELLAIETALADPALAEYQIEMLKKRAEIIRKEIVPGYKEVSDAIEEMEKRQKKEAERIEALAKGYGTTGSQDKTKVQQQIEDQQKVIELLEKWGVPAEEARRKLEELELALAKLNLTALELKGLEIAEFTIDAMADAFSAAIQGSKSFAQAFEDMGRQVIAMIAKIAVKWAIIKGLQALFPNSTLIGGLKLADGGVIQNGQQVTAYAKGGVVDRPTLFPMAKGMGLMGEAGPEAVMPLRRGPNGRLGVEMNGGGVNVTVINNAGAQVQVEERGPNDIAVIVEQASRSIASDISRGDGMVSRSIQNAYRLSRAGR